VLAVWRIDRLGRSVPHLVATVGDLTARGIQFRSLTESIDTTTAGGELIFTIFAALAQMERRILSERTRAGLDAARVRGRVGGRPSVMTKDRLEAAKKLRADGMPLTQIAAVLGVGRATVRRALQAAAV
jgi:DNA invertase Pin-like site-specific DNA recombinase